MFSRYIGCQHFRIMYWVPYQSLGNYIHFPQPVIWMFYCQATFRGCFAESPNTPAESNGTDALATCILWCQVLGTAWHCHHFWKLKGGSAGWVFQVRMKKLYSAQVSVIGR